MYNPIRGGTRGGQGDFKWSDVSADKDRENYLGHSINAPTGRWQKNKDVHWYNRDKQSTEEEKREEIRKIKEAEEDALAVALGFKPNPRTAANPSTSVPTPVNPDANTAQSDALAVADKGKERQETRRRKEEKRERKSEKRDAKLRKLGGTDEGDGRRSGPGRGRSQSRSPPPNRRDSYEDRSHRRHSRSRSPHRRTSLPDSRRRNSRSRSPPPRRPYDASEMDKERERDRRRWEVNAARERPGTGHWGR